MVNNKNNSTNNFLSNDYDATISLLNVYLQEWIQRDNILWSQIFKFFYAILIITLLPNISSYLQIDLPSIPILIFRICGIIFSFIFLYVSLGYVKRLEAISDTCQKIIDKFPSDYTRVKLSTEIKHGKYFMPHLSYIICIVLFSCLLFLSILLIFI